jgi:hypothetical protein
MGLGNDESLILDAYRLARYYYQNPEVFLAMTVGEIRLHMQRTHQLAREMSREQSDGD